MMAGTTAIGGRRAALLPPALRALVLPVALALAGPAAAQDEDERLTMDDVGTEEPGAGTLDADPLAGERLIERGEAFTALPLPCGSGDAGCESTAEAFCTALGYGPPIDTMHAEGQLHVIRCRDEI